MNDALLDALTVALVFPAAYLVTWLVVRGKITEPLVNAWQFHWESRWIKRHARGDEEAESLLWESNEWNSKLAYLPTCAYCTGYWVSVALVASVMPSTSVPVWPLWPLLVLASTAATGLLDALTHNEA